VAAKTFLKETKLKAPTPKTTSITTKDEAKNFNLL
jgi:hypothetical protein